MTPCLALQRHPCLRLRTFGGNSAPLLVSVSERGSSLSRAASKWLRESCPSFGDLQSAMTLSTAASNATTCTGREHAKGSKRPSDVQTGSQLVDDHHHETVDALAVLECLVFEKLSFTAECLTGWNGWAHPLGHRLCVRSIVTTLQTIMMFDC